MNITKRQFKDRLGIGTDVEMARFFGVSKQAVCAWQEDEELPEGRQWQARALRPDLFETPAKPDTAKVA